jgi:hypothetical protein
MNMALYAYGTNLVGRRKKLPDLMNCGISIYLHCSRIDSLILDMSVNHLTGNRRLELEPPCKNRNGFLKLLSFMQKGSG